MGITSGVWGSYDDGFYEDGFEAKTYPCTIEKKSHGRSEAERPSGSSYIADEELPLGGSPRQARGHGLRYVLQLQQVAGKRFAVNYYYYYELLLLLLLITTHYY